jgi:Flp pilus assembly protein TadB
MDYNERKKLAERREAEGRRKLAERREAEERRKLNEKRDPDKRKLASRRELTGRRELLSRRRAGHKRKHKGSLMPNIYFSLQAIILYLVSSIIFSFNISEGTKYIVILISIVCIIYFLIKRREVMLRQEHN